MPFARTVSVGGVRSAKTFTVTLRVVPMTFAMMSFQPSTSVCPSLRNMPALSTGTSTSLMLTRAPVPRVRSWPMTVVVGRFV